MLGSFLDRVFVAGSDRTGELPLQAECHTFRERDSSSRWVYFIPEFCYHNSFIKNRLILDELNIDVYILPKTIVQPDPKQTCKFLDDILDKAIQNTKKEHTKEINVLGISMGNVLAFRFAEYFQINKFISVVPGSRLAECIWESIATRDIAQNSGRSLKEYQETLSGYNPIESVPLITPRHLEIYLGTHDLMIPFKRGEELAQAMQTKPGLNVDYKRFSGHFEAILSFSKRFSKI